MIIQATLITLWHYIVIVTRQQRCKFLFSAIIFKEIFKVSFVGVLSRYFRIPIPGSMVVYIRIAPLIGWPILSIGNLAFAIISLNLGTETHTQLLLPPCSQKKLSLVSQVFVS